MYVDDYASGADSIDSAFCLFERSKKGFIEGDMRQARIQAKF